MANECIEPPVVDSLRELGYDVMEVWDWLQLLSIGNEDRDVMKVATDLNRIIVTYDKQATSFGDDVGPGLVVSRHNPTDFDEVARYIDVSLRAVGLARVPGSLAIIEPGRVRGRDSSGGRIDVTVRNR